MPTAVFLTFLCCGLGIAAQAWAKTVILFSIPHLGNLRPFTNVGRALTQMGHEAYVCIPHYMLDENMVNTEGIKVIPYGKYLGQFEESISGKSMETVWAGKSQGFSEMRGVGKNISLAVRQILSDNELLNTLKGLQTDILVLGYLPPFVNLVVLPYIIDVKFAYMTPFNDLAGQRVPFLYSMTACPISPVFHPGTMSFRERLMTTFCNIMLSILPPYFMDNSLVQEFAPDKPPVTISELTRRAELFILESDIVLEFLKPSLPHMKLIGNTAHTAAKALKKPFKRFVENSKNGIAVVTFGSMVVDLPEYIAKKMVAAFKEQNLDIVWRVNSVSPNPDKILTSSWVPQNDILAHPKTKLFVSHCGVNGQYEAVYHGVPMLCLPFILDQQFNAHRITAKGFGLQANVIDLSASQLAALMTEVTKNETYRNQIKKASALYRQLYKNPQKEASFWIDHVMQYGGAYMRWSGLDAPFYQYLALDIMLFFACVVVVIGLVMYAACRCSFRLCQRCCGKQNNQNRTKKD